jgi:hypothetical protein
MEYMTALARIGGPSYAGLRLTGAQRVAIGATFALAKVPPSIGSNGGYGGEGGIRTRFRQ